MQPSHFIIDVAINARESLSLLMFLRTLISQQASLQTSPKKLTFSMGWKYVRIPQSKQKEYLTRHQPNGVKREIVSDAPLNWVQEGQLNYADAVVKSIGVPKVQTGTKITYEANGSPVIHVVAVWGPELRHLGGPKSALARQAIESRLFHKY